MNYRLVAELSRAIDQDAFDPALFPAAAAQAERFLMSVIDCAEPAQAAMDIMLDGHMPGGAAERQCKQALCFMQASTLTAPTQNTGKIIDAFDDFSDQHKFEIQSMLKIFSGAQLGDMRDLIKKLESRQILGVVTFCDVSVTAMVYDCIAHDDLEAYLAMIGAEGRNDPWSQRYGNLANFEQAPDTRIHQACILEEDDLKNLFVERIKKLRRAVESPTDFRSAHRRYSPDNAPKLLPAGQGLQSSILPNLGAQLYLTDYFADSLRKDMFVCTRLFFERDEYLMIEADDGWDHIDAITDAFIRAGVTPQYLMTHGVLGEDQDTQPPTLERALTQLGEMSPENARFYSGVYRAYLKDFDRSTLIDNCVTDGARQAMYTLTRDTTFLLAASSQAKDSIFASDLGL